MGCQAGQVRPFGGDQPRRAAGPFELLFGVDDPADPSVPVIERLQREFSQLNIRLNIAPARGANRKAGTLHNLAGQARYEIG